jgi:hypothetical protein
LLFSLSCCFLFYRFNRFFFPFFYFWQLFAFGFLFTCLLFHITSFLAVLSTWFQVFQTCFSLQLFGISLSVACKILLHLLSSCLISIHLTFFGLESLLWSDFFFLYFPVLTYTLFVICLWGWFLFAFFPRPLLFLLSVFPVLFLWSIPLFLERILYFYSRAFSAVLGFLLSCFFLKLLSSCFMPSLRFISLVRSGVSYFCIVQCLVRVSSTFFVSLRTICCRVLCFAVLLSYYSGFFSFHFYGLSVLSAFRGNRFCTHVLCPPCSYTSSATCACFTGL